MMMNLLLRQALICFCLIAADCQVSAAQETPQSTEQSPMVPSTPDKPFTIEVNVNRVLVPVVVRDKQGNPVGNLKKEDFQIFADNKEQPLSGFMVERRLMPSRTESTSQSTSTTVRTGPQRFLVFLFDDTHLNFQDLTHVQKAAKKVLGQSVVGSDIAAVMSLSGKTNSGLTRDQKRLEDTIMSLRTQNLFRADGGECPNIDFYQADQIENRHDSTAFNVAVQQTFTCQPSLDPTRDIGVAERQVASVAMHVLMMGQQDSQVAFATILEVVRRMAKLPGQSTLILVSPGFLTLTGEAMIQESHIMDIAAEANVRISALDARGLYTSEFEASDRSQGSGSTMQVKAMYKRSSATQAENVMSELADATGGTFFHNSNDFSAGFRTLADAPECVYMLQFSPDGGKSDGEYHKLKVKVDRDGLELQARHGYFAPKAEKHKK